jgi:DNA-binding LacI/PurR family transcriptional regulator
MGYTARLSSLRRPPSGPADLAGGRRMVKAPRNDPGMAGTNVWIFGSPARNRRQASRTALRPRGRGACPNRWASSHRPAFACIQDSLAFGAFLAAAGRGVGRDLTIPGGQNFPGSEHAAPPLSTFSTEDSRVADLLSQVMIRHLDQGGQRSAAGFERREIKPTPLLRQSHLFPT